MTKLFICQQIILRSSYDSVIHPMAFLIEGQVPKTSQNRLVDLVWKCHHLHFFKIFNQSPVPSCRTMHKQRSNLSWRPARGWGRILEIQLSCEAYFHFLPWSESRWKAWISCRSYRQNERGRCQLLLSQSSASSTKFQIQAALRFPAFANAAGGFWIWWSF